MKYNIIGILLFSFLLSATGVANAQNKTAPKKTMPAKPAAQPMNNKTMKEITSNVRYFEVNGVRVILKPATNDVVSAVLFISGGVGNYNLENQGIENLALNVLVDGGSKNHPKESYHDLMESKGISIGASASYDYSTVELRTIDKNWNLAWDLFQDVLTHPAWDQQSFEQTQNQIISSLLQDESDPDETIQDMSVEDIFKGQRYERKPDGTPESLKPLTIEQLKTHYVSILTRKKMVLVVVGKVNEADLKAKVQAAFGTLPEGKADKFESHPPVIKENKVKLEEREIATNYIRGIFNAPPLATRESVAMRIAISILYDRLFVEVRTKRNLSYAPSANMSSLYDPYNYLYVSTTKPSEAVQVMTDEIRKVKKEGFSEKELRDKKESFLTNYYMSQETNSAQAASLGVAELRQGWRYAEIFKDEVKSLSLQEVNAVFKKYAEAISWYYLGQSADFKEDVFKKALN